MAEGIGLLNQRIVFYTMGSNPISSVWGCSSIGRAHALVSMKLPVRVRSSPNLHEPS